MSTFQISGQIVDVVKRRIFPGTITVENGKVSSINEEKSITQTQYILPGFIDSHIHIESSMLLPSEFARLATVHGAVASVSDPHEIGNVLGVEGIRYMIQNGNKVPFHFYFGASSCVPATSFETAGAEITAEDIETLFKTDHLKYLSEMMNYPGVIHQDPIVMKKLAIAKAFDKPIDGHAPGLKGRDAQLYISAGISTDHECYELDEALGKLKSGMKIIIREGSAAKNYEALHSLIKTHPEMVMFCSDDKHPHELVVGHINELVVRSIALGYELFDVLRITSYNPVMHYKLDVGLLQPGDGADFIVVKDLKDFQVQSTYVKGILVSKNGKPLIASVKEHTPNHFKTSRKQPHDFEIEAGGKQIHVIRASDGQLITQNVVRQAKIVDHKYVSDPAHDLLKLVVVNRYQDAKPAIAFIENIQLKHGAIASCIAHDSHNIIAVGCTDAEIATAVNALIEHQGGISVALKDQVDVLPLPVAGIMSPDDGYEVAKNYEAIDAKAKALGTKLSAPFMTLSFMALLVIPELKLSDKGLFDGKSFKFIPLEAEKAQLVR